MCRSAPMRWYSSIYHPTLLLLGFRRGFSRERQLHQRSPRDLQRRTQRKRRKCMQEVSESTRGSHGNADIPKLSIVVIGRNEGARLAKCLDSIGQVQSVLVKEIIYVDSASSDGSPELASQYGAVVIVVRPERLTAAIGRNAGWRRAESDLVLFLDGDTVLHRDFPRAACDALSRDPSVAAVDR